MTEARDLHTQNVNIRDAELRLTALDVSNQLPRQVTHSVFKTKIWAKWHVQKLTHRTTQIHIDATDILRQNMCFLVLCLKNAKQAVLLSIGAFIFCQRYCIVFFNKPLTFKTQQHTCTIHDP